MDEFRPSTPPSRPGKSRFYRCRPGETQDGTGRMDSLGVQGRGFPASSNLGSFFVRPLGSERHLRVPDKLRSVASQDPPLRNRVFRSSWSASTFGNCTSVDVLDVAKSPSTAVPSSPCSPFSSTPSLGSTPSRSEPSRAVDTNIAAARIREGLGLYGDRLADTVNRAGSNGRLCLEARGCRSVDTPGLNRRVDRPADDLQLRIGRQRPENSDRQQFLGSGRLLRNFLAHYNSNMRRNATGEPASDALHLSGEASSNKKEHSRCRCHGCETGPDTLECRVPDARGRSHGTAIAARTAASGILPGHSLHDTAQCTAREPIEPPNLPPTVSSQGPLPPPSPDGSASLHGKGQCEDLVHRQGQGPLPPAIRDVTESSTRNLAGSMSLPAFSSRGRTRSGSVAESEWYHTNQQPSPGQSDEGSDDDVKAIHESDHEFRKGLSILANAHRSQSYKRSMRVSFESRGSVEECPVPREVSDLSSSESHEVERRLTYATDGRLTRTSLEPRQRLSQCSSTYLEDEDTDADSTDEIDMELKEEPPTIQRPRSNAVSAEAYGVWNLRPAKFAVPSYSKTREQCDVLTRAFQNCLLFSWFDAEVVNRFADAMPLLEFEPDQLILKQGEEGHDAYVIVEGKVDVFNETPHDEIGWSDSATSSQSWREPTRQHVRTLGKGSVFGEMAMLWSAKRTRTIYSHGRCVLGQLGRDLFQALIMRCHIDTWELYETHLRNVKALETLNDEQISKVVDAFEKERYMKGDTIIKQGQEGDRFFMVVSGECVAEMATGTRSDTIDVQEHRRYVPGDLFGERALLHRTKRAVTITACSDVEVLYLRRAVFERMLGSLSQLQSVNYLSDPRKSIADYYQPGDQRGPRGAIAGLPPCSPVGDETKWFAVYRPTSRDAIAKMLSGRAVGKGLNVKGKSAKKNRLSGFVPFLQISQNKHKDDIEDSPPDSRIMIFYTTETARKTALSELQPLLSQEVGLHIVGRRNIEFIDKYTKVFGLDVPEPVIREAYITRPDISFRMGWETGRHSEPAFMDMNLHAVRGQDEPKVVLYQLDSENDPMNPHGLLIAYAENTVKPVVSDFDTLTVGSKGMAYAPMDKNQVELAQWSLDQTKKIFETPGPASWNTRWLAVLREANKQGFCPPMPKYGFGDDTSYGLIKAVVAATQESGAVRHGAECFNFLFPQELDTNYLVVWEGFPDKPWDYKEEQELKEFLMDRIDDGFSFPLNPVWPVRDEGWFEIYEALMASSQAQDSLRSWFPPESKVRETIREIRRDFPEGFQQEMDRGGGFRRSISQDLDLDAFDKAALVTEVAQFGTLLKESQEEGSQRMKSAVVRMMLGKRLTRKTTLV